MKKKQKQDSSTQYADNPLVQAFAWRLKQWRQDKGLTLKAVAAKTGFSTSILCEWEHAHRFPDVMNLSALAKFTGISASEFIRPIVASKTVKKVSKAVSKRRK